MAINPITVSRLKTWTLIGHSNADGWAPSAVTFSLFPYLLPGSAIPIGDPANAYWKNSYVATSKQAYPSSPDHIPVASNIGDDVEWLEMTIANTGSPSGPHPHGSPYQYPNIRGVCYPHYFYNHYEGQADYFPHQDPSLRPGGTAHGVEIPFNWHWQHYWGEQVGLVKVAVSSSFLSAQENGGDPVAWLDPAPPGDPRPSSYTPSSGLYVRSAIDAANYPFNAWWSPSDQFDWAPATKRLYQRWYEKMAGAQSGLPAGTKMDCRLAVVWVGDNDSTGRPQEAIESSYENTLRSLVDAMRQAMVDNDWTTLTKSQIPVVLVGVHPTYQNVFDASYNSVAYCNGVAQSIAADDDYVEWVDSAPWNLLVQDGIDALAVVDSTHFGPTGYRQASDDIFEAFLKMQTEPFDALDQDETITLSQARDRVRTYYSKSRSNTDHADEIIDQHLNAAMYHVMNHVGDNAWWLRRRKRLEIQSGPNTVMALPKFVHRMMVIESPNDPDYSLTFKQIGHGSGGKLLINFGERGTGTYWCQFITVPKELTRDDQIVPAPKNITEWIIVETCSRMAAASSNAVLMGHFAGQAQQLMSDSLRSMGQTQRSKKDKMSTQRRRPNLRYGRGIGRLWARDY